MKISPVIVVCCAFTFAASPVISSEYSSEFIQAMTKGAQARIALKVVDDDGVAVPSVKLRVQMGMNFEESSYWIDGETDKNGAFLIEGKTTGNKIAIGLSKDGYYDSRRELHFIRMGSEHEVKDGKWQPWGKEERIVLRKRKKPIKMVVEDLYKYRRTNSINKWIGYDIEQNDYVAPYGKGEKSDFEVYIDWDGRWLPEYSGMSVKIRFTEPYSGYCPCLKDASSSFKWPYKANAQAEYSHTACFGESVCSNGTRKEFLFDKSKCWIVRSRCKVDESGKLISANYSVISGIGLSCKKDGVACFCVIGAFNPAPNDTNLEPKR